MKYAFAAILLLVLVGVALGGWMVLTPVSPPSSEVYLDLPAGTSTLSIARKLQDAGVIRSRYAFLLLRVWKRGKLKAGEYRFAGPESASAVYTRIVKGDISTLAVTIPEGYNLWEIANAVEQAGLARHEDFLAAAHTETDLIAEWSPHAKSLEGYLYPETYRFNHHTTPRHMLEAMVHRFRVAIRQLGMYGDLGRTVTMASMVEKEVRFDDERALAAGVFENRLIQKMPLQTDPTVVYAALLDGRWTGTIHQSDLQADSPYNTYRHLGLPPGPICSPGAAALQAAMHPARTANLYFVAGEGGHTRFSATLGEHAQQVQAYRRTLVPAP